MRAVAGVKECSACGRPLPAYSPQCPYCGESLRNNTGRFVAFCVATAVISAIPLFAQQIGVSVFEKCVHIIMGSFPCALCAIGVLLLFIPPRQIGSGIPTLSKKRFIVRELSVRLFFLFLGIFAAVITAVGGIISAICGVAASFILILGVHTACQLPWYSCAAMLFFVAAAVY